MMLGSDVSSLTTTAKTAAAQGLSIVVPVYNEAAGLSALHQRLIDLARSLRARYGLACEVVYVDDGSGDEAPVLTASPNPNTRPLCDRDVRILEL